MLNLFTANFRKEYIEMKRYFPNTLAMLATFYMIFLGIFMGLKFGGNPVSFAENMQYSIVSLVISLLAIIAVQSKAEMILQEAMRGTLEQLFMSPFGMWKILFARISAEISLNTIVITVLLFAAQLTSGQWLSLNPLTTIPILIITLISMAGVGFMLAGLAIIFKQVAQILGILNFVLMGLVFVPLSAAPFLAFVPFVKGVDMIRTIMMNNQTLFDIPPSDYLILIINTAIYFSIGLYVYIWCEKIAMRKGTLSQY